ncbi:MAG TPA: PAS domain S-box protein [Fimbriimonadaceae bacterium]|jgi:PAS domain S-box-containing protein
MPRDCSAITLSSRQLEIIRFAREGLIDKEIATRLGIGVGSVKTQWERIRKKMGDCSRMEVIARLGSAGLDPDQDLNLDLLLQMFYSSGNGLALMDEYSTFINVNPSLAALFGYCPKELIGKTLHDLLPANLHNRALETFRLSWEDLPCTRRWHVPDRHGNLVSVQAAISHISSKDRSYLLVSVSDLTDGIAKV